MQAALRRNIASLDPSMRIIDDGAERAVNSGVPPTAGERKSVQPVVSVQANGGPRADVKAGQAVEFSAVAEAPPKAGVIVKAEWDFEGASEYPVVSEIKPQSRVVVTTKYAFSKPGTYFPALRVTSNRQGDTRSPYAQVQNLGRLRVVVT